MDCRTVRTLIDLGCTRRTGEMQADDARLLDAHLGQCPDCRIFAAADQGFDTQLAATGKALSASVIVPDGLRDRLFTRLAAERFAFYLTWTLKIGVGLAIAVGLILGLYLRLKSHPEKLPPLSTLHMLRPLDKESRPADPDDIRYWFYTTHGIDCELPAELKKWDFTFLTDRFVQWEFGHGLPTLLFQNGDSWAKVTLLHHDQFEAESLTALVESLPRGSRVLGRPEKDAGIALVLIQSGSYEDFLKK